MWINEEMRLDLSNLYIFYWLLNFIRAAVNEDVPDNCFYNDKDQDFFFTISIAGIQENVSCTDNCLCNGTNAGYSTVNCQSCCFQRRIMSPGRLKWFCFNSRLLCPGEHTLLLCTFILSFKLMKIYLVFHVSLFNPF